MAELELAVRERMDVLSEAMRAQRSEAAAALDARIAEADGAAAAAAAAAAATAGAEAVAALEARLVGMGGEVEALRGEVSGLEQTSVEHGREISTLTHDVGAVTHSVQQQVRAGV